MKNKIILVIIILVSFAGGWYAADKTGMFKNSIRETALEHAVKHLDSSYVCPMHSQIVRKEQGTCPICGMDLAEVQRASKKEKKILYWVAPMDANYRRDDPGKSPMGMDLVPVYDDGEDGIEIRISPAVVNNMGVRTAKVERGPLWRRIDTVAAVDYDESKLSHIHLRTEGWIEKLAVRSEGERVKKGDRLFNIYSPTLVNAMEEYLQALKSNNRRLVSASKDRLVSLGVSKRQILSLEKTKKVAQTVAIYAQQDGVVAALKVREGMFVKPASEIMRLADLSSVWILAEVFESQVDWVELGQNAEVSLSYLPGKQWEGKVEYIYPSLDPKTRTLKVRLQFNNPDEELKPNMYAHINIYGGEKKNILTIPREALIRIGQQQRVIVDLGEGRFAPQEVKAGIESGDWIEIINGLNEGDNVVISGQFLIDSEASLKASLMRMQE